MEWSECYLYEYFKGFDDQGMTQDAVIAAGIFTRQPTIDSPAEVITDLRFEGQITSVDGCLLPIDLS